MADSLTDKTPSDRQTKCYTERLKTIGQRKPEYRPIDRQADYVNTTGQT